MRIGAVRVLRFVFFNVVTSSSVETTL